jgi:hypothetical protein
MLAADSLLLSPNGTAFGPDMADRSATFRRPPEKLQVSAGCRTAFVVLRSGGLQTVRYILRLMATA